MHADYRLKRERWIAPLLLFLALTGLEGVGGPADELSLEEAVRLALSNNPLMRATGAGLEAAEAQLSEARSARLPSLDFNQRYVNSNNPVYVFGSRLEQGEFEMHHFDLGYLNNPGSYSNFRSSVNLKIPVFNRFQVSSGIRQAEIRGEQAENELQWVQQQLRMEVVKAYYGLLVARARMEVAREAVVSAESEVVKIQSMFDEGMVVASDVLAMQVQVADFRQQLLQAESDEQTALAGLNTVLALPVEAQHQLIGQLEEREFAVPSQSELIARAIQERPDLKSSGLDVLLSEESLRIAKGRIWPDFNLFADYGFSSMDLTNGSGDFAVGAALNLNILDMGKSARIRQAAASTTGVRAQQEHKANAVRFEVVEAHQAFQSSRGRLQVAAKAVEQAAETLRIVQDRHGAGLTTITEVLRAQTTLLRTRFMLLGARYEYYIGYAKTLLATGSMNDVTRLAS